MAQGRVTPTVLGDNQGAGESDPRRLALPTTNNDGRRSSHDSQGNPAWDTEPRILPHL